MLELGSTYLIVKDMEKSINFYEQLLEMKVSHRNFNRWAQFNFSGNCIALYNNSYDYEIINSNKNLDKYFNEEYINYLNHRKINYGNNFVLNFWIEDLNAEYERIKGLGIGNLSEIMYLNIASPYYFFVLEDPDNNTIEITGNYKIPGINNQCVVDF